MDEENTIKLVLIGDKYTGKTKFVQFLITGIESYNNNYTPTVGASYVEKKFIFNNKPYTIELWDTGGQSKYIALLKFFFKDADIIFIFFDYNNKKSFEKAKELVNYSKEDCENNNVVLALIGNKFNLDIYSIDIDNIVHEEEILEYVDKENLIFAHLSVLETYSTGINELFKKSLKEYVKKKSIK